MLEVKRDGNRVTGLLAETNDASRTATPLIVDPSTSRLLVSGVISNLGGLIGGITYDEIDLTYTGSDMTGVTYKLLTATVASLTLTYSSSVLQTVVRTA